MKNLANNKLCDSNSVYCFWNGKRQYGKSEFVSFQALTHSHTMTPFDAPGKQAF